jgi:PAS domain-containing protein
MKKITEMKEDIFTFYENMNEIVYITDMDTYDIVYMNRKTRELYGLKSPDEYRGNKCYTFFQGSASPCAICTNSRLKSGSFKEWKYFNPKFGKTFLLKDTMLEHDGRRYRLEIAVDATFSE